MSESVFSPEKVERLHPYIQETANSLLDALKKKGCANGPVDLVKEFALPLPSYVRKLSKARLLPR